mgnify:CR=1 FL=1|tara:strand:+ start:459 stop:809 length:351 start_codon:yes stop_codon:yes gene_type:complete
MTANEPKVRSVGKVCTAAVANTVYTCPPNFIARMVLLFVVNHGGNNKTVSVEWNDLSASQSYHIVGGYILTANGYLKLDGSYLVLNAGDTLIVTPEAGATMDTTVTVEEYYFPKLM